MAGPAARDDPHAVGALLGIREVLGDRLPSTTSWAIERVGAFVGFFSEMQREIERERRRQEREYRAALRAAEKAQRDAERQTAWEDKEARRLYAEERAQEVVVLNEELAQRVVVLESILDSTLEVDDYIDLSALKQRFEPPAFRPGALAKPDPEPQLLTPAAPSGFGAVMPGARRKHEAAVAAGHHAHEGALAEWRHREAGRAERLAAFQLEHEQAVQRHRAEVNHQHEQVDHFEAALARGDPSTVVDYFGLVLEASRYPDDFPRNHRLAFVPESKQVVLEFDLPPYEVVPDVREYKYVKARDDITATARPVSQRKALYSSVVAQASLRCVHEIFEADRGNLVDTLVFNGMVDSIDKRTGKPARTCVVSLRTTRDAFGELDLGLVDPQECLRGLNAGVSRKPSELAPVRPVIEFSMVDDRFTDETDVLSSMDGRPNLMELTPTEFEALITNLFERMGLETRQTRPSRDGGVDCVAWDARPILGGKVVIQAKRYKNTVGVSAVRDLYGTVHNEGAAKGILIATSGYGKASFEFANGKPLELLDGNNLLYLLTEYAALEAKIEPPDDWVDPADAILA